MFFAYPTIASYFSTKCMAVNPVQCNIECGKMLQTIVTHDRIIVNVHVSHHKTYIVAGALGVP